MASPDARLEERFARLSARWVQVQWRLPALHSELGDKPRQFQHMSRPSCPSPCQALPYVTASMPVYWSRDTGERLHARADDRAIRVDENLSLDLPG